MVLAGSLFITRDSDCPNIMLLSSAVAEDQGDYLIGESLINLPRARTAIASAGLTIECVSLLFALGGCDFTAGTRRFPQVSFLKALFA